MGKRKRPHVLIVEQKEPQTESVRHSDEPPPKKPNWKNRQRVLIFSSRGILHRGRHLMKNLKTLLPHSKSDTKMEKKDNLAAINDICQFKNCNKCLFFEARKNKDLYLWISNVPDGPSAKFLVENLHTMEELKMTGNCLAGSRTILTFDKIFDQLPQYKLLKELFVQIFGTPKHHPRSQPFIDRTFVFSVVDNRIWFRNYQLVGEDGSLAEIGPRFVLNPVCLFDGSFGGTKLWSNPKFVTPNAHRRQLLKGASEKYLSKIEQKVRREVTRPEESYKLDDTELVFQTFHPKDVEDGKMKVRFNIPKSKKK